MLTNISQVLQLVHTHVSPVLCDLKDLVDLQFIIGNYLLSRCVDVTRMSVAPSPLPSPRREQGSLGLDLSQS